MLNEEREAINRLSGGITARACKQSANVLM